MYSGYIISRLPKQPHSWNPNLGSILFLLIRLTITHPSVATLAMFSIAKWIGSRRASHAQATERNSDSPLGLYNTASTTEKDKTIASGIELTEETALEAQKKLKVLQRKHEWDPNLPSDTLEDLDHAAHEHDLRHDLNLVSGFEDNSPYPEVRAAVRNVGDSLFLKMTIC